MVTGRVNYGEVNRRILAAEATLNAIDPKGVDAELHIGLVNAQAGIAVAVATLELARINGELALAIERNTRLA